MRKWPRLSRLFISTAAVTFVAAPLTLVTGTAQPARAALSPRCGSGVSQGVGLTLQACVRADLQHVHGAIYLHVNATGAATYQGSTGTLSVRIDIWKYGQIANAASWNSSPYTILNMPNVYILYSFDAPYVHGLGYQTVGNDRGRISSPARAARSFTHRPFTHRRKFGRDLFSF